MNVIHCDRTTELARVTVEPLHHVEKADIGWLELADDDGNHQQQGVTGGWFSADPSHFRVQDGDWHNRRWFVAEIWRQMGTGKYVARIVWPGQVATLAKWVRFTADDLGFEDGAA